MLSIEGSIKDDGVLVSCIGRGVGVGEGCRRLCLSVCVAGSGQDRYLDKE